MSSQWKKNTTEMHKYMLTFYFFNTHFNSRWWPFPYSLHVILTGHKSGLCMYTHSAAYRRIGANKSPHGYSASAVLQLSTFSSHWVVRFLWVGLNLTEPANQVIVDPKFQWLAVCQPHWASCLYQNPFSPKAEIARIIFWNICWNVLSSSNSCD